MFNTVNHHQCRHLPPTNTINESAFRPRIHTSLLPTCGFLHLDARAVIVHALGRAPRLLAHAHIRTPHISPPTHLTTNTSHHQHISPPMKGPILVEYKIDQLVLFNVRQNALGLAVNL